ncbi:hypothetical protein I302_106707 [Kwoniella bestiolae CBS 10118]|uniref:Uncharacterized protein n=1 Tax=Kwoniella bestiolae CBS 10118 TaxID=1296100 RepID=A0A1B9G0N1_9TREE|nr:hypothetical protein I302_06031 [Kwoniella bestiolae CBS 10118]OCF24570.1 hypothetical protein I302_06031 [Kwoniella bestiolae CBS 10118]
MDSIACPYFSSHSLLGVDTDSSSLRPTRSRTTTGYSSRYSSAPTSRCPSPTRTRTDELSRIISQSITYPNPSPSPSSLPHESGGNGLDLGRIKSNLSSLSIKLKSHRQLNLNLDDGSEKKSEKGKAPEGFKAFVQSAKEHNPGYRTEKLSILKPVSKGDGYGWFMDRQRGGGVDE